MTIRTALRVLLGVVPLLAVATVVAVLATAPPASAAALQEITNFGTNPSSLRMFVYVPNTVAARPAIVVAVHYCHGDGPAFYAGSQFASLADRYGFVVIYPSVTQASDGCFDVASPQALTRDGGSDPVGIMSMVRYVQQHNNGDPNRVYATGVSSGAMMTNVLLGDYPDVFKAGAAFAGVPFGCFAGPTSWNTECANGQISKTPQQWGDLVRAAFPGYTGARPRMQLWHGTADTTLNYANFAEEIKQWTNVLGVSQTPTSTDSPQPAWTRTRYANSAGTVLVEAVSMQGVPHNLPVVADAAIHFFGLDTGGTPTASPPSPSPTLSNDTPGPGNSCRVTYTTNVWNTGFTASIAITNTGSSTINGWSLAFTLPTGQAISSGWNATFAPGSGQVTARNVGYNGTIAPSASATGIGFQATHTGNSGRPTSFTLNGTACVTS
jgi:acetylxylan esterase